MVDAPMEETPMVDAPMMTPEVTEGNSPVDYADVTVKPNVNLSPMDSGKEALSGSSDSLIDAHGLSILNGAGIIKDNAIANDAGNVGNVRTNGVAKDILKRDSPLVDAKGANVANEMMVVKDNMVANNMKDTANVNVMDTAKNILRKRRDALVDAKDLSLLNNAAIAKDNNIAENANNVGNVGVSDTAKDVLNSMDDRKTMDNNKDREVRNLLRQITDILSDRD
jgi:hypothetical protein